MEYKSKKINFWHTASYSKEFKHLMDKQKAVYGDEIFNLNGIGNQLDINEMSKQFLNTKATSDVSVDANANVSDKSVISLRIEMSKPMQLVNSYYRLWKELRKNRSIEYAEHVIKSQINGRIYINDFTGFSSSMPYSYYGKTTLVIKQHGDIIFTSMEELFKEYSSFVIELPDRYVIDLSSSNIEILDDNNSFVKLEQILRHKSHCGLLKLETKNGYTTVVTEDHPIIMEDMSEKNASSIRIGDRLKISNSKFNIEDNSTKFDNLKYITGFVIGDGHLLGDYQVSITQKDLRDKKIFKIISEEFPDFGTREKNSTTDISFGNKQYVKDNLDISRGSGNKKLPKNILNWSRKEILSLIAGIIDSDGCINKNSGVIDIRMTSFTLIQQVAELLRWLDFERVRTSFVGKNGDSRSSSKLDTFRVSFVCNDLNLVEFSEKLSSNREITQKNRKIDGRYNTNEVHKITLFTQEYVYDVTTSSGKFHSQGLIQHNCFNYSTYDTALLGIPAVFDGKGGSKPPKNMMSFLGQEELFSLIAGNSTLGATGLADLLIVMSIYMDKILKTGQDARFVMKLPKAEITKFIDSVIRKLENKISVDDLDIVKKVLEEDSNWEEFDLTKEDNCWRYLESILTGFIYRLNQPYRGSQSLFSNVSVYDKHFLKNMLPAYVLEIDGEEYRANLELVQKVQDCFLSIMNNELARKPLTFPVTTACFSVDEQSNVQDLDFVDYIAKQNLKFGFINIYSGKSSTLSSCCRLRSEQDNEYFNSFGSGSSKIGSLGVATGNLPQLAYKVKKYTEEAFDAEFIEKDNILLNNFLDELKKIVIDCQEVNNAKRNIVSRTIKSGNHPIYSLGYMDLKKQYSTFGVVGLYEALEILGLDILTEEGQTFVIDIMNVINETNKELQKKFKAPHNCEQIPAENVSVKLAKLDRALKINDKYDLYSNQFIPLVKNVNILDRITLQGKFDKHFSGGAIAHLNMDQEIKDVEVMKNLIISCAKQGVVYFAINYVLQECEHGHLSVGNVEECPICGESIVNKYTRIVGFLTRVSSWIKERRELDFPNRVWYKTKEL